MQTSALHCTSFVLISFEIQFILCFICKGVKNEGPELRQRYDWQALVLENMAAEFKTNYYQKKKLKNNNNTSIRKEVRRKGI